mmetsp:Transcript_115403/g.200296  ORF Transcript_115403/g.200296 Transcript_115403/m.200296 type:complete len:675 (-) Transcript_115403:235-2259(-)
MSLAVASVDPVFEALGLQQLDGNNPDVAAGAVAAQSRAGALVTDASLSTPCYQWQNPAWAMYAQALAAAASVAASTTFMAGAAPGVNFCTATAPDQVVASGVDASPASAVQASSPVADSVTSISASLQTETSPSNSAMEKSPTSAAESAEDSGASWECRGTSSPSPASPLVLPDVLPAESRPQALAAPVVAPVEAGLGVAAGATQPQAGMDWQTASLAAAAAAAAAAAPPPVWPAPWMPTNDIVVNAAAAAAAVNAAAAAAAATQSPPHAGTDGQVLPELPELSLQAAMESSVGNEDAPWPGNAPTSPAPSTPPSGDSEKENVPLNLSERIPDLCALVEKSPSALKNKKVENDILATPPPRSIFRADAPCFVPQPPAFNVSMDNAILAVQTPSPTGAPPQARIMLERALPQVAPPPLPLGELLAAGPKPAEGNLYETPEKAAVTKKSFVETRACLLRFRDAGIAAEKQVDEKPVPAVDGHVQQTPSLQQEVSASISASNVLLQLVKGEDSQKGKADGAALLRQLKGESQVTTASKDGAREGAALLRQLQAGPESLPRASAGDRLLLAASSGPGAGRGAAGICTMSAEAAREVKRTGGKAESRGLIRALAASERAAAGAATPAAAATAGTLATASPQSSSTTAVEVPERRQEAHSTRRGRRGGRGRRSGTGTATA